MEEEKERIHVEMVYRGMVKECDISLKDYVQCIGGEVQEAVKTFGFGENVYAAMGEIAREGGHKLW